METVPTLTRVVSELTRRTPAQASLALARHAVLDTCGCILAGATSEQAERLGAMQAAAAEAGLGARALRLGVMAHALDFDDYEEPASTHPSAALVPALLTLVAPGGAVSLRDALSAYVAGFDLILTLGKVLGYGHYMAGWHATSTLARPGAALTAARLLGLDPVRTVSAVSIAMTQSAGLKAQFGTDTKALHAGLAARSGVESALLAQAGFTASPGLADGPFGFAALFGTERSPGWEQVAAKGLPSIAGHPPFAKPWPSCGYTIRPIEAAIRIAGADGFDADAIERISVRMPEPYHRVAGIADPATPNEARFSTSYCVAAALARGGVGPETFEPPALAHQDIRRLMARLDFDVYPMPDGAGDMSPQAPDTVTVTMRDGRRLRETVAAVLGGPGRLLSGAQIAVKYRTCGGAHEVAEAFLAAGLDDVFDPGRLIAPAAAAPRA